MQSIGQMQQFYQQVLTQQLLPFWQRAEDTRNGGVFTCFSNDGARLVSTDKYIWSQGRMAWIYARLAQDIRSGVLPCFSEQDAARYLQLGLSTCAFIRGHAVLEPGQGVCAYLTTADGRKKESIPGKGYYTSYFVDCFVILGFAGCARAARDAGLLEQACSIYDRMMALLDRGIRVSEPYPVRQGFDSHAEDMILTCVCAELAGAAREIGSARADTLQRDALRHCSRILDHFYSPDYGVIQEMPPLNAADSDTFLARHIMPCHALESMWFCLDVLEQSRLPVDSRILNAAQNSLRLGWDMDCGGMLRCVDIAGGRPDGRTLNDPYELLMRDTWDSKLWWTNAEALYASLRFWFLTGNPFFADYYERIAAYDFSHFPNPDAAVGEWIQILDRQGRAMDKVVALPVKDPFHILRDMLRILELLHSRAAANQ